MQTILARIFSVIFHPLIMPSAGLLLLFSSGTYLDFLSFSQKRTIFMILLAGTAILPLSLIPVLILQRMVANIRMDDHRERVLPLMITSLFYVFTWYMLARLNIPGIISVYVITGSLAVLLCALVSLRWKISLHMTALGALAGVLLAISFRFGINLQLWLTPVFLAGGTVGWARLSLKAHTPAQIYAGYVGGLVLAFIMISFF
ncbi:MAG: hypothetical protein R6U58_00470 [Bacteroidales bacterium]